jgi:hypothetical protein
LFPRLWKQEEEDHHVRTEFQTNSHTEDEIASPPFGIEPLLPPAVPKPEPIEEKDIDAIPRVRPNVLPSTSTEPLLPLPPAVSGPRQPISFLWLLRNDEAEPREWSFQNGQWHERYPNGNVEKFVNIGAVTIGGDRYFYNRSISGMEIRRADDNGERLFIPNVGEPLMWICIKPTGSTQWSFLGLMENIQQ